MDLVLVFPLILIFVSCKESYSTAPVQPLLCPPGNYKGKNELGHDICIACGINTFTAINNSRLKCVRCDACQSDEKEIRPCTRISDVECECKDGYYRLKPGVRMCLACNCHFCQEPQNGLSDKECKSCEREACMTVPECKRKCTIPGPTPSTTTPPKEKSVTSLCLLVVVVIFVVLCMLLLPFAVKSNRCPRLSTNKRVELHREDPKLNGQGRHQSRHPTTLTFTISEEAPIMALSHSPAQPRDPDHICPLLPNAKQKGQKAVREEEQSERWPAIVLYAIIKQVPLRRWKEFLRLLSVADQQLERVELETGLSLGYMEKQYHMLRLWSQRSTASLDDVFSALHYMDLSGCAQLLQESLEKLQ